MYVLVWLTKYSSPGQKILPLPLSKMLSTQLDQNQLAPNPCKLSLVKTYKIVNFEASSASI
jgi:hypothetical protein